MKVHLFFYLTALFITRSVNNFCANLTLKKLPFCSTSEQVHLWALRSKVGHTK